MTAANGGLLAGGMNGVYWPDVVEYRLGNPSQKIASFDFTTTNASSSPAGSRSVRMA